jgi:hypothetical protein
MYILDLDMHLSVRMCCYSRFMICALSLVRIKSVINYFSLYRGLCLVSCSLFDFQKTKLLQFTTLVCFLPFVTLIQSQVLSVVLNWPVSNFEILGIREIGADIM